MIRRPCRACGLHAFRRNIVEGRGSVPAQILFIGDAPGRSEDLIGKSMIGPDGKLLDMLLSDAGIVCSYYVINCCGCRACNGKILPQREPEPYEILACMPRVMRTVDSVRPKRIVLLGKAAARYYGKIFKGALRIVHPSLLMRSGGRASPYYSTAMRSLNLFLEDVNGP